MNANEMSYQFDVLYDSIASLSSPGYTAQEKGLLLTNAQDIIVDRLQPKENNEQNRRALDNLLRTVDISTASVTQDTGKPNGVRYDLPSGFMYHESEEVTVVSTADCFNGKRIMVHAGRQDEYSIQIKNPHKRPMLSGSDYDNVWRLDFNDNTNGIKRVDLITDGTFTVGTYHLTYMKQPIAITPLLTGDSSTTVQSDCELDSAIHREIVETAIRLAAGASNNKEYQIKINEENLNNN